MVMPTDDDRAMAVRFHELFVQLDVPGHPGREIVNNARLPWISMQLLALEAKVPVRQSALNAARGTAHYLLPKMEAGSHLMMPPPLLIPRATGPIIIDGKMDEPAWTSAPEVTLRFDNATRLDGEQATGKILWDDKYLYVGYTVPDAHIVAPPLARDGAVYSYDCVELFLCPNRKSGAYWELNVSPSGSLFDCLTYKYPARWGGEDHLEATMEGLLIGRAMRGPQDAHPGYTIELAVPFDQLPGMHDGGHVGDTIYTMLGRANRDSEAEGAPIVYTAHQPYVGWLHNIWDYQPFILGY